FSSSHTNQLHYLSITTIHTPLTFSYAQMDFLNKLAKGDDSKPTSDAPDTTPNHKPTNSDLFSDAKVVAAAAQAQFNNQTEGLDKAKAASSAANILDAAEQYGKLDSTTGVGKYAEQAEDYLRKYGGPGETKPTTETAPPAEIKETVETKEPTTETAPPAEVKEPVESEKPVPETTPAEIKEPVEKKPEAEGGVGDYVKMAEGVLDKEEGGESGGGIGGFAKKAGGFFK
ncbi:hypothetical protein ABTP16_08490, partial [Acinetobacter baumannii]